MGTSYPEHRHSLRQNVDQLATVIHLIFHESSKLNFIPAKLAATLRLPVWRRFVDAVQISLSSAKQLVDQLIPLAAEDGMLSQLKHENVPHEKIVNIAVDLILAGADTTPYTMVWALYLLARNSDVQDEVAEKVRNTPVEQWTSHPLLRAVARETLRLYPAAPFIARILPVDIALSGFTVCAGVETTFERVDVHGKLLRAELVGYITLVSSLPAEVTTMCTH
ncbi:hypothetical protein J6590_073538 [Homalodisca vitripennis]|nr:hypothetical protein J6590_073538 [Homalodisca vitripennis]